MVAEATWYVRAEEKEAPHRTEKIAMSRTWEEWRRLWQGESSWDVWPVQYCASLGEQTGRDAWPVRADRASPAEPSRDAWPVPDCASPASEPPLQPFRRQVRAATPLPEDDQSWVTTEGSRTTFEDCEEEEERLREEELRAEAMKRWGKKPIKIE